jgi:hypothetical protein
MSYMQIDMQTDCPVQGYPFWGIFSTITVAICEKTLRAPDYIKILFTGTRGCGTIRFIEHVTQIYFNERIT